ncbi:MAG TPA: hypothetical protein VIB99_07500 [Candidatus Limnocylindrales bacterium]|jgi:hypothetical protein
MASSAGPTQPDQGRSRLVQLALSLRVEDWLLFGWVSLAAPVLGQTDPSAGPFDPGRPVQGTLELIGVAGALICLVTGRSDPPPGARSTGVGWGATGPLVGGLLLVSLVGWTGLGLSGTLATAAWIALAVVIVAVRWRWPALPTVVRRALVTPFILAAGGIFWSVIDTVTGGRSALVGQPAGASPGDIAFLVGLLAAFSSVYYAMLIFAPRQVAEPEGRPVTWLLRFGVFLVSVAFGLVWLRPVGV